MASRADKKSRWIDCSSNNLERIPRFVENGKISYDIVGIDSLILENQTRKI